MSVEKEKRKKSAVLNLCLGERERERREEGRGDERALPFVVPQIAPFFSSSPFSPSPFFFSPTSFAPPLPPFFPPFPSEMAALATASKACAVVRSNSARAAPVARSCSSSRVVAAAAPAAAASPALASRSQRMSSASPAAGRGSVAAAAASNGGLSIDLRGKRVPDAENDAFLTENRGPSNESRSFFFPPPRGDKKLTSISLNSFSSTLQQARRPSSPASRTTRASAGPSPRPWPRQGPRSRLACG